MLNEKDTNTLTRKVNNALDDYHARVIIKDAPEAICKHFEDNTSDIIGNVVVVRSRDDEAAAAIARNNGSKVLFVFLETHQPTSYFSGTSHNIHLSNALIGRSS